ncbi:MAG: DUF1109 domain-containing protein [Azoarcus sp.]|jgi:hypothetical protein|nr:DUF1109 domain-containing protein [Azoarcus sp.]
MKTDELIVMLATGVSAVDRNETRRRFALATGLGGLLALILMLTTLGLRTDLAAALATPMFWAKLAFAVVPAVVGLIAVFRLGRPGARVGWAFIVLAVPVLAMWALGVAQLVAAPAENRAALLFGRTWLLCPLLIGLLATPVFILVLSALKDLAPTRPTLTGAMAGIASGAVGATVYCLHCPEMAAPFVSVWYLLGMLIPAVVGAACGRRVLRW